MNENLIMINRWKEKKNCHLTEVQTKEYFQLLSFDQLISESKDLRNRIAKAKYESINPLSIQTKLIFDEIQNRMISSQQKDAVQEFQQSVV